jgi:hypothetical protein
MPDPRDAIRHKIAQHFRKLNHTKAVLLIRETRKPCSTGDLRAIEMRYIGAKSP